MANEPKHFPALVVEVREGIKAAVAQPRERLVATLVEEETERRARLLRKGYDEFVRVEAEARKIKPGHAGFDAEGNGIGEPIYTQEQAKKLAELGKKLTALDEALEAAHTKGDYQKIEKLVK